MLMRVMRLMAPFKPCGRLVPLCAHAARSLCSCVLCPCPSCLQSHHEQREKCVNIYANVRHLAGIVKQMDDLDFAMGEKQSYYRWAGGSSQPAGCTAARMQHAWRLPPKC